MRNTIKYDSLDRASGLSRRDSLARASGLSRKKIGPRPCRSLNKARDWTCHLWRSLTGQCEAACPRLREHATSGEGSGQESPNRPPLTQRDRAADRRDTLLAWIDSERGQNRGMRVGDRGWVDGLPNHFRVGLADHPPTANSAPPDHYTAPVRSSSSPARSPHQVRL